MVDTPPPRMRKIGTEDESRVTLAGRIMVGTIIAVFFLVVIILSIHIFARVFWWRRSSSSSNSRRRRFVFALGHDEMLTASEGFRRGVDPVVMKHLPVVVFSESERKDAMDCAVCLSEVADGEKARILPNCSHGFHVECIDMWLQSHSSCPLCRTSVDPQRQTSEQVMTSLNVNSSTLPTNVLYWGNEARVTSVRLEESLVIDIPSNNFCNDFSSSIIRSVDQDELRSPLSSRLRSFTRLLTMNHPVGLSTSSTDMEQEHETQRIQAAP